MEIHTFRAASLQEALMLVRQELGAEASVVQTRELPPRLFGMLGKRRIEVDATRDAKVLRRFPAPSEDSSTNHARRSNQAAPSAELSSLDITESDAAASQTPLDFSAPATIAQTQPSSISQNREPALAPTAQLNVNATQPHAAQPNLAQAPTNQAFQLKSAASGPTAPRRTAQPSQTVRASSSSSQLSPAMFEVFTDLLDTDVDPEAARLMLQHVASQCTPAQLDDPWLIKGRLCQTVQQQIEVSGPIQTRPEDGPYLVALVGPTGVGKTTTLAKLAAGFHFEQGAQVGFITLDTFRLGAVDQLRQYADLLAAPLEVVSSADQLQPALDRLRHCHLILIDTAGRSPRDAEQLEVLHEIMQVAQPDEVHLVLSASSSRNHAQMAIEQFALLKPTHLLLSKLDESTCLGGWYPLLTNSRWPLSYLTTGQHVPEDLMVANSRRVASLILGQAQQLIGK